MKWGSLNWIDLFFGALVAVMILAVVSGGFVAWQNRNLPTFELKKEEWECVKDERRTHLQPLRVGKVGVMQPIANTVCVEYRRIGG